MSIAINANMYLLCNMFNISYKKITDDYLGMTIEEIMEAEAEQGNTAAAHFNSAVLSDPVQLIKLFQLNDPSNKFAILSNMSEQDLEELLPMLEELDLIEGLNYFNKDKLLEMIEELPIEQLIKLTFEMFPPDQVIQLMPEEQLDKILQSTDIDKKTELKYLQAFKPEILAQILEAVTEEPAPGSENTGLDGKPNFNAQQLLMLIADLPDDKFQKAMLSIPLQHKRDFIFQLTQENPKLYQSIDAAAYTKIIDNRKEKQDIIKSAHVIEKDQLVKMVEQLPKDLTAAVLTQINAETFAKVLLANFKNIISQIAVS